MSDNPEWVDPNGTRSPDESSATKSRVYYEGLHHGVLWYADPLDLIPSMIDPALRAAVLRINESGWCWTAESCQGHPDDESGHAWASNVRPMLRLVCQREHVGRMFACLIEAVGGQPFEVFPSPNVREPWFEALVYVNAATMFERDSGCQAFETFSRLLGTGSGNEEG